MSDASSTLLLVGVAGPAIGAAVGAWATSALSARAARSARRDEELDEIRFELDEISATVRNVSDRGQRTRRRLDDHLRAHREGARRR